MSKLTRAIEAVEKYMECANSVGHSAASYRDQQGKTHLLVFSDLRTILNEIERTAPPLEIEDEEDYDPKWDDVHHGELIR